MTNKYRCSDGLCGADDCSRCHPEWQDDDDDDDGPEYERDDESCSVINWVGSTHALTY